MNEAVSELLAAAAQLESFLYKQGWRFCFIGGVAVQRWGEPRFTRDLDLTLLTGFGVEEEFIDRLLTHLQPRRQDAREFALRYRVLLARTSDEIEVDVALGALPFEARTIDRASSWVLSRAVKLTTCSAEDLIIHKVFAGRDIDWLDVERILARQCLKVDLELVRKELIPLIELKDEPDSIQKFERLIATIRRRLRDGT